jgi:hypothetical protein
MTRPPLEQRKYWPNEQSTSEQQDREDASENIFNHVYASA